MSGTGLRRDQAARAAVVKRERWTGRPLIVPPEGGEPVPYARISSLAKTLEDGEGLTKWKQRKTAEGLLVRSDLYTLASGVLAGGDPDTDWSTKRELDNICKEATEAAGASSGASAGTGFHKLTEALDRGQEPKYLSDVDRGRLDAYREATAAFEVLDVETFVVCDELRAAGTFDRLWRTPQGRVVVADLKTGKSENEYPLAAATQIAAYAHGQRYDPATGERTPLHPDIDLAEGILIHMPARGGCALYGLDLRVGWEAAQLAAAVLSVRAIGPDGIIWHVTP